MLLARTDKMSQQLYQFQNAGIQIALDDFGTGYSALTLLHDFNISYLKIDRSLTQNVQFDSNEKVLTEAIIVMAHKLGLKVIVEGVETEQQKHFLLSSGCDYAQGYLLSKPLTAIQLEQEFFKT
jgi:EAL domain-containing protein (putative c-di-GMP-specific phosphodiesterase class I)